MVDIFDRVMETGEGPYMPPGTLPDGGDLPSGSYVSDPRKLVPTPRFGHRDQLPGAASDSDFLPDDFGVGPAGPED